MSQEPLGLILAGEAGCGNGGGMPNWSKQAGRPGAPDAFDRGPPDRFQTTLRTARCR